jgi:predicted amidohydrolase
MDVAFIQFTPKRCNIKDNIDLAGRLISSCDADLIVLPELCTTGYLFENRLELEEYAEIVPGGTACRELTQLVQEQKKSIVFGIAEKCGDFVFNAAVLFTRSGCLHLYRKIHLFGPEKHYFDPGDLELRTFDVDGASVGLLICFDYMFPEASRVLALQGAQIVCHPSNLVTEYGQQVMRVRSIENRVFTITANRTGAESVAGKSLNFTGCSQITNVDGSLLCSAGAGEQSIQVCRIDPLQADFKKVTEANDVIADRRPEFYRNIIST